MYDGIMALRLAAAHLSTATSAASPAASLVRVRVHGLAFPSHVNHDVDSRNRKGCLAKCSRGA